MRNYKKYTYIIIIFLIVASCIAYGRITNNGFVNFDEIAYITENNHIKSGLNFESIKWAFTSSYVSYWHPLTWLSHMLDWSLFGSNASGHHLISLLLHIGAVIFLFLFLNKTTKNLWASAFATAFFALHPLRVESVAWAAERKDVLSMLFGMASIYIYSFYAENSKPSQYFLCLILFALALMSKPIMVTLPFILMLLDYWPLGRWQKAIDERTTGLNSIGRLIWEKIPFLLLTIASSIITFWGQNKEGALISAESIPFLSRGANAIVSYVAYLGKTVWPVNLAVFYPYELYFPIWKVLISVLIILAITLVVLYHIKKLPFLFVGWFWYLGTLIPLIGIVQAGEQSMADRHTYLPSIGIAIMLAWGIPLLFRNKHIRNMILFPAGISVLAILTILTWNQCGYWKNSIELFSHALRVTNENVFAHNNIAPSLVEEGKIDEAIYHCNEAIRINPNLYHAYYNRGDAYAGLGRYQLAIEDFNRAIRLKPDYASAYNNRGNAYVSLGQYQLAIEDFKKAIQLNQDSAEVYNNCAIAYAKLGKYQLAFEDFNKAVNLKPDYASAYNNRGNVYISHGQYQIAIEDFNKAISLKPDYASAYYNRGNSYVGLGQYQLAIEDFNKAISLKPDYIGAYNNRGVIYLNHGNKTAGCYDVQKACALGNCKALEWAKDKGLCP